MVGFVFPNLYGIASDAFLIYLFERFKRTGNRDQIFLATKFGVTPSGPNGTPEYVRSAAEKSLKRLGVETIDLYYLHVSAVNYIHVTLQNLILPVSNSELIRTSLSR
jgi:aryl-alcohol dehydrogenase-like predicted oxidoreductase